MFSRIPTAYAIATLEINPAPLEVSPVFRSPGSGGVYSVSCQTASPRRAQARVAEPTLVSLCPDCGAVLQRAEGCWLCRCCGYSPCS